MGDGSLADEDAIADSKIEPEPDHTPSSIDSTPEPQTAVLPDGASNDQVPPQKRKGGRKPIYATSEERKQRNRQAQAAFRERRTEYIKQLEATIKQIEETLSTLQQSHRTTADECLMLRYKNSLLERILLEKGVNVQAELQLKTGSPVLGHPFIHPGAGIPHVQAPQPPLQRTAMRRQLARRSGSQTSHAQQSTAQAAPQLQFVNHSPQGHPTPSSHTSSPTHLQTRSPGTTQRQGGISSPSSAVPTQGQVQQHHTFVRPSPTQPSQVQFSSYSQQQPQEQLPNLQRPTPQRPGPPPNYQSSASVNSSRSANSQYSVLQQHQQNPPTSNLAGAGVSAEPSASAYYPSPFQKHIDQLELEYDTEHHRATTDDDDGRGPPDHSEQLLHGSYPAQQYEQQGQMQQQRPPTEYYHHPHAELHQQSQAQPTSRPHGTNGNVSTATFETLGQILVDPDDPMLDADPFGLSASMHYPTAYATMEQRG